MDVDELKSIIGELAQSQGHYGRLWRQLDEDDGWEALAEAATEAGCTDALSFIIWHEGG